MCPPFCDYYVNPNGWINGFDVMLLDVSFVIIVLCTIIFNKIKFQKQIKPDWSWKECDWNDYGDYGGYFS